MARKARDVASHYLSKRLDPSIVRSTDAVAGLFDELARRCRSSVDILVKSSLPLVTANAAERRVLEKGIPVRCIYERSFEHSREGQEYLKEWAELGEQQRVIDSVPLRAAVVDRSILLVTGGAEDRAITSLLVVRAGLGEAIAHLFDLLWDGHPLMTRAAELPRPLTEQEMAILRLMCDGAGDQKIARDLNISKRTVQRRLQEVGSLVGADSRAGLAARAVALGLVTPYE